jgi:NADPH:quinone reductase-like Zn-dependent oxidoreductase/NAD(P)-dependent dehydrogenase (short-subunit alcohol dehydrogenase family)/SAM-dependent methyltransferase
MVMAVEALRQIINPDLHITGFQLKDIMCTGMLIIPDTQDGIEISLSFSPADESSHATSKVWHRFHVDSYIPEVDSWVEHCTGYVAVVSDTQQTSVVDGQVKSLFDALACDETYRVADQSPRVPLDFTNVCDAMEDRGLRFGPSFRNFSAVTVGSENAGVMTGTINVSDIKSIMPATYAHPYLIHPTTMEAVLQAGIAAICDVLGQNTLQKGYVPQFIKRAWLSTDMYHEKTLRCYGVASSSGLDRYDFNVRVCDGAGHGLVKVAMDGVRLRPFQSDSIAVGSNENGLQQYYSIDWRPDGQFLTTADVIHDINSTVEHGYSMEKSKYDRLQLAAILLAADALSNVQTHLSPDTKVRFSGHTNVQELLVRLSAIVKLNTTYSVPSEALQNYASHPERKQRLYMEVAGQSTYGALMVQLGSQVPAMLLQEGHSLSTASLIINHTHFENMQLRALEVWLTAMKFNRSGLRVLEVGSAMGGAFTQTILRLLSPNNKTVDNSITISNYTFTGKFESEFAKIKEQLADWEQVLDCRTLDPTLDPNDQGFATESFDIIIGNDLHVFPDSITVLKNIQYLLKPGGKLVLYDRTKQGNTPCCLLMDTLISWQSSTEEVTSISTCNSTEHSLNDILKNAGLSAIEVDMPDYSHPELTRSRLLVSTAVKNSIPPTDLPRFIIICKDTDDATTIGLALHRQLEAQLSVINCSMILPCELAHVDLSKSVCIALVEWKHAVLKESDEPLFANVRHLLTNCQQVVWVSGDPMQDPAFNVSTGLIRTVRWEQDTKDLNLITFAADFNSAKSVQCSIRCLARVIHHQFVTAHGGCDGEKNSEYRVQNGQILTNRLTPNLHATKAINSRSFLSSASEPVPWTEIRRPVMVDLTKSTEKNKCYWQSDTTPNKDLGDTEIEVKICAAGLPATKSTTSLGEAAGIVSRVGGKVTRFQPGDRVVYMSHDAAMTLRTFGRADQCMAAILPHHVPVDLSAGIPIIYTTVLYSLKQSAKLTAGESILINGAAQAVGQAAIQYARTVGVTQIFAVVSSNDERTHLTSQYGIPATHIFSDDDITFGKRASLMAESGVDVVLNTAGLSGEATRQSWELLAPFGRFIDIGHLRESGYRLDLSGGYGANPNNNITVASVDIFSLARLRPQVIQNLLQEAVHLWSEAHIHEARPTTVIPYSELVGGLQTAQSENHLGKVVVVPGGDMPLPVVPELTAPYEFPGDASYILAGGLGGIGRCMALWMASRGARHLIFLSRSGRITASVTEMLEALRQTGCQGHVFPCNIADRAQLASVIEQCEQKFPPIKGSINCSVSWDDGSFQKMSHRGWQHSLDAKVAGSLNLHELLPRNLDFFVLLASITGVIGNRSQANYNAGNTFQDALARYRISQGLRAASIDLGAVLSVGFMAENKAFVRHTLKILNTHRPEDVLAILEYVIDPRTPMSESTCQLVCGLRTPSHHAQRGTAPPRHFEYPMFTHVRDPKSTSDSGENVAVRGIRELLAAAQTPEEAAEIVQEEISNKLATLLNYPAEQVAQDQSVRLNGADSMLEMEFRSWLGRDLGATVTYADLATSSIAHLSLKLARASSYSHFD